MFEECFAPVLVDYVAVGLLVHAVYSDNFKEVIAYCSTTFEADVAATNLRNRLYETTQR